MRHPRLADDVCRELNPAKAALVSDISVAISFIDLVGHVKEEEKRTGATRLDPFARFVGWLQMRVSFAGRVEQIHFLVGGRPERKALANVAVKQ